MDILAGETVFNLRHKENFVSSGCPNLDSFLKGGLLRRGITQIYGEAGTGKTQLALQLCLTAQIPSAKSNEVGGAAYICTEAAFPSCRLSELLSKSPLTKKYSISNEQIFVEHISNTEDLENCIFNSGRFPQLLKKYNIKLLVIDSVAATYRVEYDSENLKSRAKSLRNLGYKLQQLAKMYEIVILCINQVTAVINNTSTEYTFTKEQPSLGISWANIITNSFYMYKRNNHRYLHVAGSSYLPCKTIEYEIIDSGVLAKIA